MFYPILIIALCLYGLFSGWRKGMVRQVGSLLALAFGVVCARIFGPVLEPALAPVLHTGEPGEASPMGVYVLSVVSGSIVFIVVSLALRLLAALLTSLLKVLCLGAVNSILGAVFGLCKWVVILSVALNLWLCITQEKRLLDYCDDGDGNVVETVMSVAPALMDTEGPDNLEHNLQMEEAKTIS